MINIQTDANVNVLIYIVSYRYYTKWYQYNEKTSDCKNEWKQIIGYICIWNSFSCYFCYIYHATKPIIIFYWFVELKQFATNFRAQKMHVINDILCIKRGYIFKLVVLYHW